MDPVQNIETSTILDGARRLAANARELFEEATVLRRAGAFPRSYCLHQISLEECAKIEMLGALQPEEADHQRCTHENNLKRVITIDRSEVPRSLQMQ